jgi:hypothetical protein
MSQRYNTGRRAASNGDISSALSATELLAAWFLEVSTSAIRIAGGICRRYGIA